MNDQKTALFIGVDGGGTKCRIRIRNQNGVICSDADGGPANIYSDSDAAIAEIKKTLDRALAKLNRNNVSKNYIALGLGLAGIIMLDDPVRVAKTFSEFKAIHVDSDAMIACLGAHAGKDGAIVIAGTGSAGLYRTETKIYHIGRRGFRLGDEGSAARIGSEALRQTLLAADDLKPETPLTKYLLKKFDQDPAVITRFSIDAKGGDYGALAPLVFEYALKGDEVGLPIVKHAARALLDLAHALQKQGAERVALTGGLSKVMRPWIALEGEDPFSDPLYDPVDGAILLAGGSLA
ncbi:MAG: ATPase [Alphaproteobacteria bacterium]|nr:ATPase [Alphaproteobacteria bacterium]